MKATYTRECCIVWRLLYVQYTQGMKSQLGKSQLGSLYFGYALHGVTQRAPSA